jgi:hypothetical protein
MLLVEGKVELSGVDEPTFLRLHDGNCRGGHIGIDYNRDSNRATLRLGVFAEDEKAGPLSQAWHWIDQLEEILKEAGFELDGEERKVTYLSLGSENVDVTHVPERGPGYIAAMAERLWRS